MPPTNPRQQLDPAHAHVRQLRGRHHQRHITAILGQDVQVLHRPRRRAAGDLVVRRVPTRQIRHQRLADRLVVRRDDDHRDAHETPP
jgi:hypothetical protein